MDLSMDKPDTQSPETRTCPVCGGKNEQRASCTFCGTGLEAPPRKQIQTMIEKPRYAGFWIRVCAYITDSIVIQTIIWLLFFVAVLGYTAGASGNISAQGISDIYQTQWGSIAGLDILVKLLYYTLFLGKTGRTPGKMLFNLKVIRTDGSPLGYGRALLRTLGYYVNMFTLWIGFLWVAVDSRKQGLHDKIAQTLEIYQPARG